MRALMEQRAQTRDKNKALIQMAEQEEGPKRKNPGKVRTRRCRQTNAIRKRIF